MHTRASEPARRSIVVVVVVVIIDEDELDGNFPSLKRLAARLIEFPCRRRRRYPIPIIPPLTRRYPHTAPPPPPKTLPGVLGTVLYYIVSFSPPPPNLPATEIHLFREGIIIICHYINILFYSLTTTVSSITYRSHIYVYTYLSRDIMLNYTFDDYEFSYLH